VFIFNHRSQWKCSSALQAQRKLCEAVIIVEIGLSCQFSTHTEHTPNWFIQCFKLTTHLHLVLRIIIRVAIPPLPHTSSWRDSYTQEQLYLFVSSMLNLIKIRLARVVVDTHTHTHTHTHTRIYRRMDVGQFIGICKGKGRIVPLLFLNWATHHEDILGDWRYSSTNSWRRH
jgi:hypothetical protein